MWRCYLLCCRRFGVVAMIAQMATIFTAGFFGAVIPVVVKRYSLDPAKTGVPCNTHTHTRTSRLLTPIHQLGRLKPPVRTLLATVCFWARQTCLATG